MLTYYWLIPALPLAGFALLFLGGPLLPRRAAGWIASAAVGFSFAISLFYVHGYATGVGPEKRIVLPIYEWVATGSLKVGVDFLLDPLTAVMLLVVTGIGFLIHVYSTGYMEHEEGYTRYFAYLNLFVFFMLLLVMGNNFVVLFAGWEGVGLCSYLLIGFYYEKEFAAAAGKKAFVVNRIGDFGFVLAIFAVFAAFGSLDFFGPQLGTRGVLEQAAAGPANLAPYTLIALLLFVGACGKSAQLPLYVWLPDAMAGPTPVSALIHAATMVTAGIYMMVRCNVFYRLSPAAMLVVAVVGAATALFAATIALAQNDIKKILAYSTVSQLGYMTMAVGVGAFSAAIFHLMTHAFFKALLFLGAGSVIHAMSGQQDIRKMGGLRRKLPVTWATFALGWLAIAGIPGLSGFFSKDEILAHTFQGNPTLWVIGFATALLTAFYMTRLVLLTFFGGFRGSAEEEHHLHESPPSMTVPLVILAIGAVTAGWVGISKAMTLEKMDINVWQRWLAPVIPELHDVPHGAHAMSMGLEWLLILLSVGAAVAGLLWARAWYGSGLGAETDPLAERFPALYRVLANKYGVDELYDRWVVKPVARLAELLWRVVDVLIIDGTANAVAVITEITGDLLRFLQTGNVRNYALSLVVGLLVILIWVL